MMKTVAEIASELGISVQAVHKRIKKILSEPEKKKMLSGCIQKDLKGKMYLNEQGEIIIKSIYQPESSTASTDILKSVDGLSKPVQDDKNVERNELCNETYNTKQLNEKSLQLSLNAGLNNTTKMVDGLNKLVVDKRSNEDDQLKGCTNEEVNTHEYSDVISKKNRLIEEVEAVEEEKNKANFDELLKLVQSQALQIEKLNEELNKERTHSREQANRILTLAEQMAELTRNNQVLLKQEQDKTAKMLLSDEKIITKKQKKSIFGWILKKQTDAEE